MLSERQKAAINITIEKLHSFYNNPSKEYFSHAHKVEDYTIEERKYFDSHFSFEKLAKTDSAFLLNKLAIEGRFNVLLYILNSSVFNFDTNSISDNKSLFQLIVEGYLNLCNERLINYPLINLFNKGYVVKDGDMVFLRAVYKEISTVQQLVVWAKARFAIILKEAEEIQRAFANDMVLLTIVSFKMKKPIGIHYPNLLGVANNAFLHYREYGDLLLAAMKLYGAYDLVLAKDHKKSFQYRLSEYDEYKPLQDIQFNNIAFKIFPELRSVAIN